MHSNGRHPQFLHFKRCHQALCAVAGIDGNATRQAGDRLKLAHMTDMGARAAILRKVDGDDIVNEEGRFHVVTRNPLKTLRPLEAVMRDMQVTQSGRTLTEQSFEGSATLQRDRFRREAHKAAPDI